LKKPEAERAGRTSAVGQGGCLGRQLSRRVGADRHGGHVLPLAAPVGAVRPRRRTPPPRGTASSPGRLEHLHRPGGVGEMAAMGSSSDRGTMRVRPGTMASASPTRSSTVPASRSTPRPATPVQSFQVGPVSGGQSSRAPPVDPRLAGERPAQIGPDEPGSPGDHHVHGRVVSSATGWSPCSIDRRNYKRARRSGRSGGSGYPARSWRAAAPDRNRRHRVGDDDHPVGGGDLVGRGLDNG